MDDAARDLPPEAAALTALGLTQLEALVLEAVVDEADTTAAGVAAATGLSRPAVSRALRVLEDLGLVERSPGVRPQPVQLVADPGPVLAARLRQLEREREADCRRAERAAEHLKAQAERLARRPRAHVRRLTGSAPDADWRLLKGGRSIDEVAAHNSTSVLFGAHLSRSPAVRRLLVVGDPPRDRRLRLTSHGAQVRATGVLLPQLVVVDGVRARVEVGTTAAGHTAWTFDPAQVSALQQLFELWWAAAADAALPA